MKRFHSQFNTEAKKLSMTASERRDVEDRLRAYMDYHPLPASVKTASAKKQTKKAAEDIQREPFVWLKVPRRFITMSFSVTAMFLLVVVPAMAEQALPGDMLYRVKVNINEEIRGSLSFSATDRAGWETERVARRLAEVRELARTGKLTPELEATVTETIVKQKGVARNRIATLENENTEAATMATMALSTVFEVQETLLKAERPDIAEGSNILANVLAASRMEEQAKSNDTPISNEQLIGMIERQSMRGYELLLSLQSKVSQTQYEDIKRRLDDASRVAVEIGDIEEELRAAELRTAWRDTEKILSFINSLRQPTNVGINEVVPIRPTYAERVVQVNILYHTLLPSYEKLRDFGYETIDPVTAEKITNSLPRLETIFTDDALQPTRETIELIERNLTEAKHLINSMGAMLDSNQQSNRDTPTSNANEFGEDNRDGIEKADTVGTGNNTSATSATSSLAR